MNSPHDKTKGSNAGAIEHFKNSTAETHGFVGTLLAIGIGIYIWLVHLLPHLPLWLGILLGLVVLIAPQIIGARWTENQKLRNMGERRAQEEEPK